MVRRIKVPSANREPAGSLNRQVFWNASMEQDFAVMLIATTPKRDGVINAFSLIGFAVTLLFSIGILLNFLGVLILFLVEITASWTVVCRFIRNRVAVGRVDLD